MDSLHSYNHYIVAFSGGKDSIACVLDLLEKGVDKKKIELKLIIKIMSNDY